MPWPYGIERSDIVEERFDAGVRLGEQIEKDMIAVRTGPPVRMVVIGAPSYFDTRPAPIEPNDLMQHDCINIRMPTSKAFLPWEFSKYGRDVKVRVNGRLACNSRAIMLDAVRRGVGLAWVMDDFAVPMVENGESVRVLEDWSALFAGFHLYYPSRHRHSPAFSLVIERLRHR